MRNLPSWALTNKFPAFYDTESGSAIEQTAKVYAAMQELIKEYNAFVEELTNNIDSFENDTTKSNEEFKACITKTVEDYIKTIDLKIKTQDKVIADAVLYMKDNIGQTAQDLINEMRANGELSTDILTAFDNAAGEIQDIKDSMPYYVYEEGSEELKLMNIPIRSE